MKKAIVLALNFPITTKGSKTWTIKADGRKRIGAFGM